MLLLLRLAWLLFVVSSLALGCSVFESGAPEARAFVEIVSDFQSLEATGIPCLFGFSHTTVLMNEWHYVQWISLSHISF